MIERFQGTSGRRLQISSLLHQRLINGNTAIAEEIANQGELIEFSVNDILISEGATDNHLLFIISGSVSIIIKGNKIADRNAGIHIGEIAAINPSKSRSATVIANEIVVACKITEEQFNDLCKQYPEIWQIIAKVLSERLEERNNRIPSKNDQIRVFGISSAESLPVLQGLQLLFSHDPFIFEIWSEGVFRASNYIIDGLENKLSEADFAIAIAGPDDITIKRDQKHLTPRDNVIFEIGLFIGRLGRQRALLLESKLETVTLDSDFSGLTTIKYTYKSGKDMQTLLGPTATEIRNIINELGFKTI